MRSKITIVGDGSVRSTLIKRMAESDYADSVMYEIIPNMPQGKVLYLLQEDPMVGYDSLVIGTYDYLIPITRISS